jgi:hypothetical protein
LPLRSRSPCSMNRCLQHALPRLQSRLGWYQPGEPYLREQTNKAEKDCSPEGYTGIFAVPTTVESAY